MTASSDDTSQPPTESPATAPATDAPSCPKCDGRMWDNRLSKRNPKAPDFKCRDRTCDGVIWPARAGRAGSKQDQEEDEDGGFSSMNSLGANLDDLPF